MKKKKEKILWVEGYTLLGHLTGAVTTANELLMTTLHLVNKEDNVNRQADLEKIKQCGVAVKSALSSSTDLNELLKGKKKEAAVPPKSYHSFLNRSVECTNSLVDLAGALKTLEEMNNAG